MICRDIKRLIQLDIDHCLPAGERAEYQAHLAACSACAALHEELLALDALLAAEMPRVELPPNLTASVMAALPARQEQLKPERSRRAAPRRLKHGLGLLAAAAALLLTAGLLGLFGQEGAGPPDIAPPPILADDGPELPVIPQPPLIGNEDDPQLPDDPGPADNPDIDTSPDTPDTPVPPGETDQPTDEQPPTYTGSAEFPAVASSNVAHGQYSLITLASYQDYDAQAPQISGNTVSYYLLVDNMWQEWQVALDLSSLPAFIREDEHAPAACGFGLAQQDELGAYYAALSPDGIYTALNRGGEQKGLFLKNVEREAVPVSAMGGGSILSFSPDSNRILFSDAGGALYAHYIAENMTITLYSGGVSSAVWSGDGKSAVFAATDAATGYSSIFRVSVP